MRHPVYTALNKRAKIGPADRDLFLAAFVGAFAFSGIFRSVVGSLVLFSVIYALAVVVGRHDPNWLVNWYYATKQKSYYDPAK